MTTKRSKDFASAQASMEANRKKEYKKAAQQKADDASNRRPLTAPMKRSTLQDDVSEPKRRPATKNKKAKRVRKRTISFFSTVVIGMAVLSTVLVTGVTKQQGELSGKFYSAIAPTYSLLSSSDRSSPLASAELIQDGKRICLKNIKSSGDNFDWISIDDRSSRVIDGVVKIFYNTSVNGKDWFITCEPYANGKASLDFTGD